MQEMIGKGIYTILLWVGLGFFCLCINKYSEESGMEFVNFILAIFGIISSVLIFDKKIKKNSENKEKDGS